MGTTIKHPVPDRVKPSFVIFDSWPLWRSGLSARCPEECPDIKNYKWQFNPVWHRMLYSCTRMATVGIKLGSKVTLSELMTILNNPLFKSPRMASWKRSKVFRLFYDAVLLYRTFKHVLPCKILHCYLSRSGVHFSPSDGYILLRKNRLMRAGREKKAGVLAQQIGKITTRHDTNRLINAEHKGGSKEMWEAVRRYVVDIRLVLWMVSRPTR